MEADEPAAPVEAEDLRLAVYGRFRRGHVPTVAVLADDLAATVEDVRAGLRQLAAQRHLALGEDGEVTMAHPFTAVPLGFSVMGRDTLWWGGCAWDSFAIPHLLPDQAPVLVATTCPACEAPHAWRVDDRESPPGDQVAHFLVPASRIWDDVVHTCAHQRIFCSTSCVNAWLDRTGESRGYFGGGDGWLRGVLGDEGEGFGDREHGVGRGAVATGGA